VTLSVLAFTLGYSAHAFLGSSLSTAKRQLSSSSKTERQKRPAVAGPSSSGGSNSDSDVVDASDSDSDAEDEAAALGSDIASVRANLTEEVKMVLVVNDSLKMSKGKIAAQAGHATLACAMMLKDVNPKVRLATGSCSTDGECTGARRVEKCFEFG
jgi:PTH2 family peptidyl-tRNA hydrolase